MNMTLKEWIGVILLVLAGGILYIVFEGDIIKGLMFFVAGILIDIGVDHLMLKWEKKRGEVD